MAPFRDGLFFKDFSVILVNQVWVKFKTEILAAVEEILNTNPDEDGVFLFH